MNSVSVCILPDIPEEERSCLRRTKLILCHPTGESVPGVSDATAMDALHLPTATAADTSQHPRHQPGTLQENGKVYQCSAVLLLFASLSH